MTSLSESSASLDEGPPSTLVMGSIFNGSESCEGPMDAGPWESLAALPLSSGALLNCVLFVLLFFSTLAAHRKNMQHKDRRAGGFQYLSESNVSTKKTCRRFYSEGLSQ